MNQSKQRADKNRRGFNTEYTMLMIIIKQLTKRILDVTLARIPADQSLQTLLTFNIILTNVKKN